MRLQGFRTERLRVRPLRPGDRPTCLRTARDAVFARLESEGELLTLSQLAPDAFHTMLARRAEWAASRTRYLISAFLSDGGDFIGDTMLFDVRRAPHARAEIGTVIASQYQGLGLGPELIAGTLAWGWNELGLEEITGFIEDRNPRSTIACLKSGFTLTTSGPIPRHFEGEVRWGWPIAMRRP